MPASARPPTDGFSEWGARMAAAMSGHERDYLQLLTALDGWLRRYFSRRLPHAHVDDAVQETLIALHAKRHTYQPDRPFGPWLVAIARYKWIDRLRQIGQQPRIAGERDVVVASHEAAVTSTIALGGMLAMLKPAQAEAIRLTKIAGLTLDEASAFTGQSRSLVKVNVHRGLRRLARLAEEEPDAAVAGTGGQAIPAENPDGAASLRAIAVRGPLAVAGRAGA